MQIFAADDGLTIQSNTITHHVENEAEAERWLATQKGPLEPADVPPHPHGSAYFDEGKFVALKLEPHGAWVWHGRHETLSAALRESEHLNRVRRSPLPGLEDLALDQSVLTLISRLGGRLADETKGRQLLPLHAGRFEAVGPWGTLLTARWPGTPYRLGDQEFFFGPGPHPDTDRPLYVLGYSSTQFRYWVDLDDPSPSDPAVYVGDGDLGPERGAVHASLSGFLGGLEPVRLSASRN